MSAEEADGPSIERHRIRTFDNPSAKFPSVQCDIVILAYMEKLFAKTQ